MNEAAILTARKRENKISMETIEEAITKTVVGVAKKSRIITEKERILTAYHEAGHAVCAHVLNLMDPVHQVTIIPRVWQVDLLCSCLQKTSIMRQGEKCCRS